MRKRLGNALFCEIEVIDGSSALVYQRRRILTSLHQLFVLLLCRAMGYDRGFSMDGMEISGCYKTKDKAVVPATEAVISNEFF